MIWAGLILGGLLGILLGYVLFGQQNHSHPRDKVLQSAHYSVVNSRYLCSSRELKIEISGSSGKYEIHAIAFTPPGSILTTSDWPHTSAVSKLESGDGWKSITSATWPTTGTVEYHIWVTDVVSDRRDQEKCQGRNDSSSSSSSSANNSSSSTSMSSSSSTSF